MSAAASRPVADGDALAVAHSLSRKPPTTAARPRDASRREGLEGVVVDRAGGKDPRGDPARERAPGAGADGSRRGQRREMLCAETVVFDPHSEEIRKELVHALVQYLQDAGYAASAMTLQDEAQVKMESLVRKRAHLKRMKVAVLSGEWEEVEKLCASRNVRGNKGFLYAVHRQRFLELIHQGKPQSAYAVMLKDLKPLEKYANTTKEFRDLCYLLSCRSVAEADSFREWPGIAVSREALVATFSTLLDTDVTSGGVVPSDIYVPKDRLVSLIRQALMWQVASSRYAPRVPPRIRTILEDYECFVVPNAIKPPVLRGHRKNVKCVKFLGSAGKVIATGSGDNTVMLWDTNTGAKLCTLKGHTSRIWDLSSNATGTLLASGSGDGVVRVWDVREEARDRKDPLLLTGHSSDVYATIMHPHNDLVASGGYDKVVRQFDVATGSVVRTYTGHSSLISCITLNARGNIIISGSKDSTIMFWDTNSGQCVNTFDNHYGEMTSVAVNQKGTHLLSSSKDNSNRLWDLRMCKALQRYRGHQNTSKSFIRACFGPSESLVISGSEDGFVYLWDVDTTMVVQKLGPSRGPVFGVDWSAEQSLLVSCGEDFLAKTWWYDENVPDGGA